MHCFITPRKYFLVIVRCQKLISLIFSLNNKNFDEKLKSKRSDRKPFMNLGLQSKDANKGSADEKEINRQTRQIKSVTFNLYHS